MENRTDVISTTDLRPDRRPAHPRHRRPDGTWAQRLLHPDGSLLAERVTRHGRLLTEAWFTPDGTRFAEAFPCREPYVTKKGKQHDVEVWRCFTPEGRVTATGLVHPGLDGGPLGPWHRHDSAGAITDSFRLKPLRPNRSELTTDLVRAVHAWKTAPVPEPLDSAGDVAWKRFRTPEHPARHLPFLLKGLSVPEAFGIALPQLRQALVNEHGLSPAAGPARGYLKALTGLLDDDENRSQLLDLLVLIASWDRPPKASPGRRVTGGRPPAHAPMRRPPHRDSRLMSY